MPIGGLLFIVYFFISKCMYNQLNYPQISFTGFIFRKSVCVCVCICVCPSVFLAYQHVCLYWLIMDKDHKYICPTKPGLIWQEWMNEWSQDVAVLFPWFNGFLL